MTKLTLALAPNRVRFDAVRISEGLPLVGVDVPEIPAECIWTAQELATGQVYVLGKLAVFFERFIWRIELFASGKRRRA